MSDPNNSQNQQPQQQVLNWNGGTGQWVPINISGGTITSTSGSSGTVITYTFAPGISISGGLEEDDDLPEEEKIVGCTCKKCKEYNEFAEPNMPDDTFVCYACRHGY